MNCKHKNIFGKPNEGIHAPRIFGLAAVDLLLTIAAAWGLAKYFKIPFWKTILALLVLGVVVHTLFCVKTPLNRFLLK